MKISFDKPIHVYFIGIGGVSMSGLASILINEGFTVSGSDRTESELTRKLEIEGAKIYYGQKEAHISDGIDLIVYTAAIRPGNPDYDAMITSGIPYMNRAEFLGELMKNYGTPVAVSGTHGKTTTTTMISEIFLEAGLDPTLSNGGVIKSINSTMRVGSPDWFIFEACEYTNSFLNFFPKVSVILNIEEDHLDFFKGLADIRNSFNRFARLLPSDGLLVINSEIENYKEITAGIACPYVTYGFDASCDFYATDITYSEEGCGEYTLHIKKTGEAFPVSLSLPGRHNVSNSLAAIAASYSKGISPDAIISALKKCDGAKRRFEYKGTVNGFTVIDDYAHHPSEIKATLNAALNKAHNRLWVVFQPHTYTRTKAFLNEFAEALSPADHVILTDVYAAREKDEYGVNSKTLFEKMKSNGTNVTYISDFSEIEKFVLENCTTNDLLITLGAGDVVNIADNLTK